MFLILYCASKPALVQEKAGHIIITKLSLGILKLKIVTSLKQMCFKTVFE